MTMDLLFSQKHKFQLFTVPFVLMAVLAVHIVLPDMCMAQTMDFFYSGAVIDKATGTQLEGVIVEVLHRYLFDTTSADGEYSFSFTGSVPIGVTHKLTSPAGAPLYTVRNGILTLNLSQKSQTAVSLYSLSGKRIFSEKGVRNAGKHALDLRLPAAGIYLCVLSINGERSIFKLNGAAPTLSTVPHPMSVATLTPQLSSARNAMVTDTLHFFKPGYHPQYVAVTNDGKKLPDVELAPVNLKNGAQPGLKVLGSSYGTTMSVYVNPTGTAVDSIVATIYMHCISTSEKYTFSIIGPFDIPKNGVVRAGDTVLVSFTDTSATGSFMTRQIIAKTTSIKCEWTETYISGGVFGTRIMEHYNHTFKIDDPVAFYSTWYTLTTSAVKGTIIPSPDYDIYLPGAMVMLTAVPDSGYGIRTWKGVDSVTSELVAYVTIYGNTIVEATFGANFPLTTINDINGGIARVPDRGSYVPGDTVKLIAREGIHGYFIGWNGDTSWTSGDTAWVVMDGPKTVSVNFGRLVNLSLNHKNGHIDLEPSNLYYIPEKNTTARMIARPDSGFRFLGWKGDSLVRISGDTAWVCMSSDRTVTVFFISDKARFIYDPGTGGKAYSVALSPDNTIIAAGMGDYAQLVNTQTGAPLKTVGADANIVNSLDFSSDGTKLVLASWLGYADVWDLTTDTLIMKCDDGSEFAVFSPDNSLLVTSTNDNVGIWSVSTHTKIDSIALISSKVNGLALSPDNKWLAVGSQFDSTTVYSMETKSIFAMCTKVATGFHFSEDSDSLMVINSYGIITCLDLKTGDLSKKPEESDVRPECAAFSPDGKTVVCGTWNRGIYILDAHTGNVLQNLSYDNPVTCIDFSRDGSCFITGDNDGVYILWSAR